MNIIANPAEQASLKSFEYSGFTIVNIKMFTFVNQIKQHEFRTIIQSI